MPPTTTSQVAGGVAFVAAASLNIGHFAAQFSGIPALAPALGVVIAISQACAKIQSNKAETTQLQERCRYLLLALNDDNFKESRGSKISQVIDGCTAHLNEILRVVTPYTEQNRWQLFYKLQQISRDIHLCHTKLDDCCREFQIRSQMQLHQWMNDYKRAQDEDHEQLLQILTGLKEGEDNVMRAITETKEQVTLVLGLLQTELKSTLGSTARSSQYHDLQQSLYNLQKKSGELPPETNLTAGEARRIGKFAITGNGAFDIWEGLWLGHEKVALKVLRGVHVSPDTQKRFHREVRVWREIWSIDRGRYILPFYGVCFEDGPCPYMVSPWMNNGDVLQYLSKYPNVNRREIIKGIASGLSILHNLKPKPIAHGDVKASNILINDSGQPLLADFGLSKFLEDIDAPFTQSKGVSDSYRWFAPELCSPGVISTHSDVFAYGMTVLEIFTGEPPFQHIRRTTQVLLEVQSGARPGKPTDAKIIERGFDDHLWTVVTACWETSPECRPSIDEVLAKL